jgi:acylphosphatase
VFSGPQPAVDAMIATCWQGPNAAHVTGIEIHHDTEPLTGSFEIVPDL